MKDIKYKKKLSGLGGADCLLCSTKQEQWLDPQYIASGFPINRSASENMQIWKDLSVNNVIKAPNDFATRKGLTQKPLTESDQRSITITHSYINGTQWFCKFLSRVIAKVNKWSLKSYSRQDQSVKVAKDKLLERIKNLTGLTLEQLNKGGHSGTTTTGNAGREFFSFKMVSVIVEIVPEARQADVLLLHKNMSVLLRIISSNSLFDKDAYKILVSDVETLLTTYFN